MFNRKIWFTWSPIPCALPTSPPVFGDLEGGPAVPQRACDQVATMRLWWHAVNLQQMTQRSPHGARMTKLATREKIQRFVALFRDQERFLLVKTCQKCRHEYSACTCVKLCIYIYRLYTKLIFCSPRQILRTPKNAQMSQTRIQYYVWLTTEKNQARHICRHRVE